MIFEQFVLETFVIIGTFAAAISGAMVAIEKKMDLFGVAILGLTTAVGGGIIRDVILNITPPAAFRSPIYATVAIVTSLIIFFPPVQRFLQSRQRVYETSLLIVDSLGLGSFTVVGVQAAYAAGFADNSFLQVFVGVMTGVGGGVLRDVLADNMPFIFHKHFYACASLIGAIFCAYAWQPLGPAAAMGGGTLFVFWLRLCAAHFRWKLPRAE